MFSTLKGKETQLKIFDEYRINQLIKVGVPIVPSSKCIRNDHIRRMFYLVKTFIPLLDRHFVPLDPKLYGWIDLDGYLLPQKCLNPLPQSVTVTCKCKGVFKSCGCQRIARNCTVYYDCNKNVCTNCKELSLDQKEKCVLLVIRPPLNISSRFCRPHLFYSVFKTKKIIFPKTRG